MYAYYKRILQYILYACLRYNTFIFILKAQKCALFIKVCHQLYNLNSDTASFIHESASHYNNNDNNTYINNYNIIIYIHIWYI